jgi:hypothetical protein
MPGNTRIFPRIYVIRGIFWLRKGSYSGFEVVYGPKGMGGGIARLGVALAMQPAEPPAEPRSSRRLNDPASTSRWTLTVKEIA